MVTPKVPHANLPPDLGGASLGESEPSRPSLGLYIHWPFCVSKCPYCDFNSFVGQNIDTDAYLNAYLAQIDHFHSRTPNHTLRTIFFGGGTPSLMPPSITRALIERARGLWTCAPDMEITLEANPNTVDRDKFEAFKHAGINRLSIGIQSFDDASLTFLGRNHSAHEGTRAIHTAREIYDRVTFDLIYARPHQTLRQWEDELTHALTFNTTHLSLYQLTIEPGTAFAPRFERGEIILPQDELSADLYTLTRDVMARFGFYDYEVSNYAKPGFESQHNLIYWRYQDYVGIGPGAHGRFYEGGDKIATTQHKAPDAWVAQVLAGNHGRQQIITPTQQMMECMMMGLRLREGVSLDFTRPMHELINHDNVTRAVWQSIEKKIPHLMAEGYVNSSDCDTIALTHEGRLRLNSLLQYLCRTKE